MKISELSNDNVGAALNAVQEFLGIVGDAYNGSVLDANLIYERHAREGRQMTGGQLAQTFSELQSEGLMGVDSADYNTATDLLEPAQDERSYEPQETNEVEITFYPEEDEPTREDFEALSTKELSALLKKHEEESSPRQKSVWDDVDSLNTAELAVLIGKLGKG
jgi:hypothetical protein